MIKFSVDTISTTLTKETMKLNFCETSSEIIAVNLINMGWIIHNELL